MNYSAENDFDLRVIFSLSLFPCLCFCGTLIMTLLKKDDTRRKIFHFIRGKILIDDALTALRSKNVGKDIKALQLSDFHEFTYNSEV